MGKQREVLKKKVVCLIKQQNIKVKGTQYRQAEGSREEARRCLSDFPCSSQPSALRHIYFGSLMLWNIGLEPERPGEALGQTLCRMFGSQHESQGFGMVLQIFSSTEHPWALQGEKSEQLISLLLYLVWPGGRLT